MPLTVNLIRFLGWSLRLRSHDPHGFLASRTGAPVMFAFWHNRILLMPYFHRWYCPEKKLMVLISQSRDGNFIAEVAQHFGIEAARGSSSRGGISAMLKIERGLRQGGTDMGVTPDGPRGPRYSLHPGILEIARHTGIPIVPVTYHLQNKWEMKSWDGFQIPVPFTRCDFHIGAPLNVTNMEDTEAVSILKAALAEPENS